MAETCYVANRIGRPCAVEVETNVRCKTASSEHLTQRELERWARGQWPNAVVRRWPGTGDAMVLVEFESEEEAHV